MTGIDQWFLIIFFVLVLVLPLPMAIGLVAGVLLDAGYNYLRDQEKP